jgi:tripartite-type tricarboxylate transporter receptor subunit TctC
MKRRQFAIALGAGCALSGTLLSQARAQTWPDKPVKLILSQPAGSGADNIARLITEQLSRKWGQAIVVENRPGGQNTIGAVAAARSPADGYTFYFATAAALVTNAYLFQSLPYDPRKDFVPVGLIGKVPFALLVNAQSPIQTFQDFVARAKANPGKVSVATEGPKTFSGMMARLLNARLGIDTNLISYVSVSAGVTDTLGGQTEAVLCDVASSSQFVKQGRLRALAVTTGKRVAGWDAVPTLTETLPGFDFAGWLSIVAPTGTPAPAIARFSRDMDAILTDKDHAARILAIGPIPEVGGTPEQFGSFVQAEHARWAQVTKEIGVLPE